MSRARKVCWFAAICAVALLGYVRSFGCPFQFDDFVNITEAETVKSPTLQAFSSSARARIVPTASYILNYQIGGDNPVGYHVVNFAIHLLATLAVYGLVLALCRTPRLRATWLAEQALPLAVAAALLFSCHPIQIQAVTYVAQRPGERRAGAARTALSRLHAVRAGRVPLEGERRQPAVGDSARRVDLLSRGRSRTAPAPPGSLCRAGAGHPAGVVALRNPLRGRRVA